MTTPSFALAIHHNIRLTREQRYALHGGEKIVTVGVSVPVWCYGLTTSEPAREVFCKYYLKNNDKDMPIQMVKDGYVISLPKRDGKRPPDVSDEEWRALTPEQMDAYQSQWISEMSSQSLLDLKDGGCKSFTYREQNKIKRNNELMSIMHYVNIGAIEDLDV